MAVFADRYDDESKSKKPVSKKEELIKQNGSGRLYRIAGSIMIGNKHTSFTKEIRAETKPEALERAFKEIKDQHKVEAYQILVSSVKEGSAL